MQNLLVSMCDPGATRNGTRPTDGKEQKRKNMGDSYDREVVRQETTSGEPVSPVSPVSPVTTSRTSVSSHSYPSYTNPTIAIIWWVVGLLDTLIAIRFLLKLFGANT